MTDVARTLVAVALGLAATILFDIIHPGIGLAAMTLMLAIAVWLRSSLLALFVTVACGSFMTSFGFAAIRNCLLTPGYVCGSDLMSWGAPLFAWAGVLSLVGIMLTIRLGRSDPEPLRG